MAEEAGEQSVDHLGQRRLGLGETWFWYLIAGATYCAAAVREKFILNWIMGPAWLVAFVWFGPILVDKVRGRR